MDKLDDIFQRQLRLQMEKMGGDPGEFTGITRIEFFKDMTLALTDELHEALNEIGWKPWANSWHFEEEAVKGELVDALHFLVNLCLVAGLDAESLHSRYVTKNKKNARRQDEGYDGVGTKCPGCKRALDDDAVLCEEQVEVVSGDQGLPLEEIRMVWCIPNQKYYKMEGPK